MRGATSPVEGQPERTPKRNRIMPAPTKFVSVGELPTSTTKNKKSTKKSTTKKSTKPVQVRPQPRVSDETRERLYQEALAYRGCEGMAPEDVRQWVDERLEAYLSKQPFWFGHTQRPTFHIGQPMLSSEGNERLTRESSATTRQKTRVSVCAHGVLGSYRGRQKRPTQGKENLNERPKGKPSPRWPDLGR